MKKWLLLLPCFFIFHCVKGQQPKHKPNPRAKALNDSAASKYRQAMGDPVKLQQKSKLCEAAIKIDSYYYDAWNNRIALQGQLDQFENEYKSLKTMERLFPGIE